MLKIFFILLSICLLPFFANAQIDTQQLVGKGSLNYLFWHVYDAKLYSDDGTFSFDKSFSLKLEYKRTLYGNEIAEHSVKEMKNLGLKNKIKQDLWFVQMKNIFPNVQKGDNITGIYQPNQPTLFYKNGHKLGTIQDPKFGKWFFKIWFDEKTSEPLLRKSLLGQN